jgi:hypothetical protein
MQNPTVGFTYLDRADGNKQKYLELPVTITVCCADYDEIDFLFSGF